MARRRRNWMPRPGGAWLALAAAVAAVALLAWPISAYAEGLEQDDSRQTVEMARDYMDTEGMADDVKSARADLEDAIKDNGLLLLAQDSDEKPAGYSYDQYLADYIVDYSMLDFYLDEFQSPYRMFVDQSSDAMKAEMAAWKIGTLGFGAISEYTTKAAAFYQTLIFDVVYEQKTNTTLMGELNKTSKAYNLSAWKKISELGIEINANTPVSPENLPKMYEGMQQCQLFKDALGYVDKFTKCVEYIKTGKDLIRVASNLQAVLDSTDEVGAIIKSAMGNVGSDNEILRTALSQFSLAYDDCVSDELVESLIVGKNTIDAALDISYKALWKAATKAMGQAGLAISIGQAVGRFGANVLVSTDKICEKFYAMERLVDFEDAIAKTVRTYRSRYLSNRSTANAKLLNIATMVYFRTVYSGMDYAIDYAEVLHDGDGLGGIVQKFSQLYRWMTGSPDELAETIRAMKSIQSSLQNSIDFILKDTFNLYKEIFCADVPITVEPERPSVDNEGFKLALAEVEDQSFVLTSQSVTEGMTLDADKETWGDLEISDNPVDLNGHTLVVRGNVKISGGGLNLHGGKLVVWGDLWQPSGSVRVNGTIEVRGNYWIRGESYKDDTGEVLYNRSSGRLYMEDAAGLLDVGGDFHAYSSSGWGWKLTAGTLRVGGDLTQQDDPSSSCYFQATGSHRTVLAGNGAHAVRVDSAYSEFATLEVADGGTVSSWRGCVNVAGREGWSQASLHGVDLVVVGLDMAGMDLDVTGSLTVEGGLAAAGRSVSVDGPVEVSSGSFDLAGGSLSSTGDLAVTRGTLRMSGGSASARKVVQSGGEVYLDGGVLTSAGDVWQSGGSVYVGSGSLSVGGDYRAQTVNVEPSGAASYSRSSGRLYMEDAAGLLDVGGDFHAYSSSGWGWKLTAGTLRVGGDLTQQDDPSSSCYFQATGSHRTVLAGNGAHAVRVDSAYSEFATLEVADGGTVSSWRGFFNVGSAANDLHIPTESLTFAGLGANGHSVTFAGDLVIPSGTLSPQRGTITVQGMLTQQGGTVDMSGGMLYVEGDYRLQNATANSLGEYDYSASSGYLKMLFSTDEMHVGGDFWFQASALHAKSYLNDGTLYVSGDFHDVSSNYFRPAGSHLTVLDGKGFRNVEFPSATDKFNRLMLQQDRQFYAFSHDTCWNELVGTDYVDPRFEPKVLGVAIGPKGATVGPRDTVQFTSWVFGENGFSDEVVWTVEGAGSAGTSIDASGLLTIGADEPAGEIVVRATSAMSPSFHATARVVVSDATFDVTDAEVTLPRTSYVYTGSAVEPEPTVTLNGTTLVRGDDYEVSYENNVQPGTATVYVSGKGRYEGLTSAIFEIGRADLTREGWVDLPGGEKGYARGGSLVRGWMDLGSSKFWFHPDGCMARGWTDVVADGKTYHYYFNPSSGNLARGTWMDIGGTKYYFRPSGNMATGWADIDGKKFYFDGAGHMLTGWQDVAGGRYYFRPSGAMATGWATIDGANYWFRPSGNMATGWADVDDAYKRYFDDNGQMLVGWQTIGGKRYYFRGSGAMQTGEATIGGKEYEFSASGVLLSDTLGTQSEDEVGDADDAVVVVAQDAEVIAQENEPAGIVEDDDSARDADTRNVASEQDGTVEL